MPPSSHPPSPSSLTSNMRSRSLSPLSGSETLPFHSGRQWYEQIEILGENTMLLDYQDHKGIAFYSKNFTTYSYVQMENIELTFLVQNINLTYCFYWRKLCKDNGDLWVRVKMSDRVRRGEFSERGNVFPVIGACLKAYMWNLPSSLVRERAYLFTLEWSALIYYKNAIYPWGLF